MLASFAFAVADLLVHANDVQQRDAATAVENVLAVFARFVLGETLGHSGLGGGGGGGHLVYIYICICIYMYMCICV